MSRWPRRARLRAVPPDRARVRARASTPACGCCRPERRAALFAVYALARRIDDIADGELGQRREACRARVVRARLASREPKATRSWSRVADAAAPLPDPARRVRRPDRRGRAGRPRASASRPSPSSSTTAAASPARSGGSRSASSTAPTASRRRRSPTSSASRSRSATSSATSARTRRTGGSTSRARISSASAATGRRLGRAASTGPIELVIAFEAERGLDWLRRGPRARAAPRPAQRLMRARDGRASTAGCSSGSPPSPALVLQRAGCRCAPGRRGSCSPAASQEQGHEQRGSRSSAAGSPAWPRPSSALDAGAAVTLYEARSRLGGATFSFERNGLWLDNGQHVALRCCTAYLGFLRRLGVEHLLPLQPRLRVPVLREDGKPGAALRAAALPAPLHLAGDAASLRAAQPARADRGRAGRDGAPQARPGRPRARRADLRRLAHRARPEPRTRSRRSGT